MEEICFVLTTAKYDDDSKFGSLSGQFTAMNREEWRQLLSEDRTLRDVQPMMMMMIGSI
jgi:hypothetical protein